MTQKTRPVIRPANKDDVIELIGEPFKVTFRGVAGDVDGKVAGIAGVMHTENLQFFGQFSDDFRRYPKSLIIAVRMMKKIFNQYDSPIYSVADDGIANSAEFLEHIGFEHFDGRIYRWVKHCHS